MVALRRRQSARHLAALRALGEDHVRTGLQRARSLAAPPAEQRLMLLGCLAENDATADELVRQSQLSFEVVDGHLMRMLADEMIEGFQLHGEVTFRLADGLIAQLAQMLSAIYRGQARS